mmetsp:Transcript_105051/g.234410  ORF Transcript_105051/g.234410 Transcript_105051/m.234410 type:complete len:223 (-) Transcript_105051:133-801(-)
MPIVKPTTEMKEFKIGEKLTPDKELFTICSFGKCTRRLERVMKKKPNVNYKSDDAMTPLHQAALAGSPEFCKKLIAAKADPNVPATAQLMTPLEQVLALIAFEEERDDRLNDFDQVNRLDDTAMAYRPDLKPYYEVKKVLEDAGGITALAFSAEPNIKPDGSMKGGKAEKLRAYDLSEAATLTTPAALKTGNFDVLKFEDGKLVNVTLDPKTGDWQGLEAEA